MIERRRPGETYCLFPGGQVEAGETPRRAVVREGKEELGLDVKAGRLVAEVRYRGQSQRFYLVERTGGEFGTGDGPEYKRHTDGAGGFEPVWIDIEALSDLGAYPRAVVEMIGRCREGGWPSRALRTVDEGRAARRSAAWRKPAYQGRP